MYVCLVDEHFALRSLGDIPVDNLLWEGDYPHGDGLWPHNHSYLEKALADVPDADARPKIAGDATWPGRLHDGLSGPVRARSGMSYDLLEGVKVVELSMYAFAPSAAAVLRRLGRRRGQGRAARASPTR